MATQQRDTGWSRVLSGGSAILIINPTYMKNILVCDDIAITNAAMLTFFNFCIVMDVLDQPGTIQVTLLLLSLSQIFSILVLSWTN